MTITQVPATVKLSEYLFTRLHRLGIRSVFGVRGDYNLRLLDFVEPAGLHWVGNCNELNAAYAADGYARINGFSALITTFGAGRLSAINGIAGAFTERAKLHHTLADGDYRHFATIASHVTRAQTNLIDSQTVPEQIDEVLKQAMIHSQPVYIEVPDDMADVGVRATVDGECRALGIVQQVNDLITATGWPTWTTIFGKDIVDGELPNLYGNYTGSLGSDIYKTYFGSADLIISLGPHHTDTDTAGFSLIPPEFVTISISKNIVQISDKMHRDISNGFLTRLLEALDVKRIPKVEGPPRSPAASDQVDHDPQGPLIQKSSWRFANRLFRTGDLILTETGTASHGGRHFKLPSASRLFGASEVEPETHRAILFIGDGSLQMSVQEISTIIKENLNVIIFVINNDGYTIERAIHGRKQGYNDIAVWRHRYALQFFGADEKHATENCFTASTHSELESVLAIDRFQQGKGLRIVEVYMGREDVQGVLLGLLEKQIAEEDS
ncbi:pyruvate decarboxylase [Penicillium malachiteum]|uniref:pyruvate decarboxylase n=1 Tax=Penicillium malachiteum TaxID=1324776 RepID=UPI00254983CA|nr:pyruvate decarboxylase [Penicillium malachiteum]KAJ5729134.1 pyruvate decarboxylase [Penicillium malachiteum]